MSARWRAGRCRSMLVPRVFTRIGPVLRPLTARSMARPTAGRNGIRTTWCPCRLSGARDGRVFRRGRKCSRWWLRSPEAERSERDEREVAWVDRLAAGGQHRFEYRCGESQGRRLRRHRWPPGVLGGRMVQNGVDDGSSVQAGDDKEPPQDRRWLEAADLCMRRMYSSRCGRRALAGRGAAQRTGLGAVQIRPAHARGMRR